MRSFVVVLTGSMLVVGGAGIGCTAAGIRVGADGGPIGTGTGGSPGQGGSTGSGGSAPKPMPQTPCENLQCKQSTCNKGNCTVAACPGGARTTVSGTIMDPAGKVPLYNITAYVPNKDVADIVDGPTCDPCDPATGTSLLSGQPIVVTKSDVSGKFTLGATGLTDVPAGDNIPLIIQVGKWRRKVTIPHVTACTENKLTDTEMTRLPRNQAEGHIPRFAITTGSADALECLLRKVGIVDAEFTPETGAGRINLYAGGGGAANYDTTVNAGMPFTPVHPWWDSLDNLKKYDIILHACEGGQGTYGGFGMVDPPSAKSPEALKALQDFADMGGRVFASHWHAYWFEKGTPSFQSIATFNHNQGLPNPYDATIETGFTTGQALSQWMTIVGGSTTPGIVTIKQNANTRLIDSAAGGNISQRWIYASDLTPQSVQYLSATTPIPGGHCGRVVLSDLHVSAGGGVGSDLPAMPFPTGCVTTDLTPQEKVLEFMLFDIASCVTPIIP
ncbi:MAG TPA: carboxypeptidase regulatory-like domain-containing protein [Polyangia bacterium]|nr:carboxypeptidase regulatory-like domain-containing protein [Polyangia bacterium]